MALDIAVEGGQLSWPSPTPVLQVQSTGIVNCVTTDTNNNGTSPSLTLCHFLTQSSSAATTNMGTQITFKTQDAAGNVYAGAKIQAFLTTATGGSAGMAMTFLVGTGGGAAVEALRIKETKEVNITGDLVHNNAAGKVGFFGAASVVQQANASAAGISGSTVDAGAKAALNAIRTALINLGLCAATA